MPPNVAALRALHEPTVENPWRILVSACLGGARCGVDGTSNGDAFWIKRLLARPNVRPVPFCPEEHTLGTPRDTPDIHGGDGFDVLDGKARVLTDKGVDITREMVAGAEEMLRRAQAAGVDFAIMMDASGACGSQVISDGSRFVTLRKYRRGPGVAAALLLRNGVRVVAQRDYRTLNMLENRLDPTHPLDPAAIDHHETEWYRTYFGT